MPHIYNLRKTRQYISHSLTVKKTNPVKVLIGYRFIDKGYAKSFNRFYKECFNLTILKVINFNSRQFFPAARWLKFQGPLLIRKYSLAIEIRDFPHLFEYGLFLTGQRINHRSFAEITEHIKPLSRLDSPYIIPVSGLAVIPTKGMLDSPVDSDRIWSGIDFPPLPDLVQQPDPRIMAFS